VDGQEVMGDGGGDIGEGASLSPRLTETGGGNRQCVARLVGGETRERGRVTVRGRRHPPSPGPPTGPPSHRNNKGATTRKP
jgi:hypothetical protein